jgi:hypothetical protein
MTRSTWIESFVLMSVLAAVEARAADPSTVGRGADRKTTVLPVVEGGGALLGAAVRDARALALDRIGERAECRELFTEHGADGTHLLLTADYRRAAPDEAGGLCEKGAAAFTGMRSGRTALCADSFLKLGRHYGAVVLLHEALHVAGLGQHPHHHGAETPQQIDRRVRRSCGL